MTLAEDLAMAEDDVRTAQIALRSARARLTARPAQTFDADRLISDAQRALNHAMIKLVETHSTANHQGEP